MLMAEKGTSQELEARCSAAKRPRERPAGSTANSRRRKYQQCTTSGILFLLATGKVAAEAIVYGSTPTYGRAEIDWSPQAPRPRTRLTPGQKCWS